MYLGSVRFFKHLILSVIALLIIVPTVSCICLGVAYHNLKAEFSAYQSNLGIPLTDAENPEDAAETNGDGSGFTAYAADDLGKSDIPPDYQSKYPELYIDNDFIYSQDTQNTVYLTFDDGPTGLTPQVLDILKQYGIHATFFVVYQNGEEAKALYQRIVDEGHTLAVHTASHEYKTIYKSIDNYLDDFARLSDMLEQVTGEKPEIFRFPGGSINSYNRGIYQELISEMLRRGYTYYDWDVSSGSSTKSASKASIFSNVLNGVSGKSRPIVLLHDAGSSATVSALPDIIEQLTASGYTFDVLTKDVRPTCFDYPD